MLKLIRFYESRGIRVVKALNQYLWNSEGKKYLDFHTGHGVAFLGHNNPYIIKSVISQLSKVSVLSTSFDIDVREEMLDVLSKVVPKHLTYTYLLNSGSEAVELALKLARKVTGRKSFVALKGSFHGRTFGALSLTWNPKYRKPFEPLLSDVRFINPGNVN
ncbi:MAG TPA: aminotransferase class III-fold pyridoxal phosphate-dependent enzyme, partial [Acidilobales archaeon]|nr:aminotransferase class III-fold pyridoxal phosphate-dependent enzyme [Acidilobales archaeon]